MPRRCLSSSNKMVSVASCYFLELWNEVWNTELLIQSQTCPEKYIISMKKFRQRIELSRTVETSLQVVIAVSRNGLG